jgi:hypothetical protein
MQEGSNPHEASVGVACWWHMLVILSEHGYVILVTSGERQLISKRVRVVGFQKFSTLCLQHASGAVGGVNEKQICCVSYRGDRCT